jgi:hypothetical protein
VRIALNVEIRSSVCYNRNYNFLGSRPSEVLVAQLVWSCPVSGKPSSREATGPYEASPHFYAYTSVKIIHHLRQCLTTSAFPRPRFSDRYVGHISCLLHSVWPARHPLHGLTLLNAELNPIWHLIALVGAHHIHHVSRVRVNDSNIEI